MKQQLSVDLLCLYCQQKLKGENNRSYQPGDSIKCDACGKPNDYDRVIEVAQQKAIEFIKSQTGGEIDITIDKPDEK